MPPNGNVANIPLLLLLLCSASLIIIGLRSSSPFDSTLSVSSVSTSPSASPRLLFLLLIFLSAKILSRQRSPPQRLGFSRRKKKFGQKNLFRKQKDFSCLIKDIHEAAFERRESFIEKKKGVDSRYSIRVPD